MFEGAEEGKGLLALQFFYTSKISKKNQFIKKNKLHFKNEIKINTCEMFESPGTLC